MKHIGLRLFISFACIAAIAACTSKKREDQFAQGQGENLLLISDYQGKITPVQTKDEFGTKPKNNLRVTQKEMEVNSQKQESLPLVNIEPKLELLKDVPFKARPGSPDKYEVVYRITDSHLKVMKRANKVDLDINEVTYAEENDGKWEVPLVGYPILGFYNVEKVLNEDNEPTHKRIEKSLFSKTDATYFRADFNRPELFQALQKSNVLPVEYFDGEWYFAATVVDTEQKDSAFMGRALHSSGELDNSSRVTFYRTENTIKAVSLNIDPRLEKITERTKIKDHEYQVVFRIPVEHKTFQQIKLGNDKGLRESTDETIPWEERKSVQLDLAGAYSPYVGSHSAESTLVELSVTDSYFSFVIQDDNAQVRIRYSFMRRDLNRKYEARLFHLSDFKAFGYFKAKRKSLVSAGSTLHDQTLSTFLTRFDPNKKEIKYYLTKNSSLRPNVVRTAVLSVKAWDKAFELAFDGTGIAERPRVTFGISEKGMAALFPTDGSEPKVLEEELERKDLGDVRYNLINIFDSVVADGPAGYGPMVKDPLTGEIISATANVWTASTRNLIGLRLRGLIRERLRKTAKFELLSLDRLLQDYEIDPAGPPSGSGSESQQQDAPTAARESQENTTSYSEYMRRLLRSQMASPNSLLSNDTAKLIQHAKYRQNGRIQDINNAIPVSVMEKNLEHFCKSEIELLEKTMSTSQSSLDRNNEVDLINRCVDRLEPLHLQNTVLHEMGHNFGLRHNYAASADPANFWKDEEIQLHFNGLYPKSLSSRMDTSSIMEYQPDDEHLLVVPGKYDIAAIRFGYAQAVELAEPKSNIKKLERPSESLSANLSGESRRPFRFCTDDDIVYDIDPMCKQHDIGTTPVESMKDIIQRFYKTVAQQAHSYDRAYFSDDETFAINLFERFFLPARRMMEELRIRYMLQHGKTNMHFENMTAEQVELLITKTQGSDEVKRSLAEYFVATKLAYQFLAEIAMTPGKYCHLDVAGNYQLIDFEELRKEIYSKTGKNVIACQESAAKAFIKDKYGSDQVVAEIGQFTNPQHINQDPASLKQKPEYRGFGLVRLLAAYTLMLREPQSHKAILENLFANFMDFPLFRSDFIERITDRIVNGMDTRTVLGASSDKASADQIFAEFNRRIKLIGSKPSSQAIKVREIHKLFAQEANVLNTIFLLTKNGMILPTDSAETIDRLVPFDAALARSAEIAKLNTSSFVDLGNGYYYGPRTDKAYVAKILSMTYSTKVELENAKIFSKEEIEKYYAELMQLAPDFKDFLKITSAQFMDSYQALGKKMNKDLESDDPAIVEAAKRRNEFILFFLADENKFYERMVGFESNSWQAPPKEILERTKAELFIMSMVTNISPDYRANLEERKDHLIGEMDHILNSKKFFESNATEFEARQSLLHKLMFGIATPANY